MISASMFDGDLYVLAADATEMAENAYKKGQAVERKAMMQLFTDPENQPTQHGTVTVEYMQREIAAEREACAKLIEAHGPTLANGAMLAEEVRARGTHEY